MKKVINKTEEKKQTSQEMIQKYQSKIDDVLESYITEKSAIEQMYRYKIFSMMISAK